MTVQAEINLMRQANSLHGRLFDLSIRNRTDRILRLRLKAAIRYERRVNRVFEALQENQKKPAHGGTSSARGQAAQTGQGASKEFQTKYAISRLLPEMHSGCFVKTDNHEIALTSSESIMLRKHLYRILKMRLEQKPDFPVSYRVSRGVSNG